MLFEKRQGGIRLRHDNPHRSARGVGVHNTNEWNHVPTDVKLKDTNAGYGTLANRDRFRKLFQNPARKVGRGQSPRFPTSMHERSLGESEQHQSRQLSERALSALDMQRLRFHEEPLAYHNPDDPFHF